MTKKLAILQARTSSERLPGKVMKQINQRPMIEWQIKRILQSKVDDLVLATSVDASDDELASHVESLGIAVFRGSPGNVFSRFIDVLAVERCEYFVRLTGDCPLVMPKIIDQMLELFGSLDVDYLSNTNPPSFPDGLDVEVVRTSAFEKLSTYELEDAELEHVTLGLYSRDQEFSIWNFASLQNLEHLRWTVDYKEDFEFVESVYAQFIGKEEKFSLEDILFLLKEGTIEQNRLGARFRNIALIQKLSGE